LEELRGLANAPVALSLALLVYFYFRIRGLARIWEVNDDSTR